MAYFDGIKVGDTVAWIKTPVVVSRVYPGGFSFPSPCSGTPLWDSDMEGCVGEEPDQTVFWQPVHIDPPPRPKRKVSKTGAGFISNDDLARVKQGDCAVCIWKTEIGSKNPVTVTIEYEE